MKSGNLNILERSGPLQACNGTALLDGFRWNLILMSFIKICRETVNLVSTWAKISDTLHEDLSTFYCCWPHTFAVKRCCAALSIFMLLTVTLTQQYTKNVLLRFHCNNGYTNALKCYVTRTLSVLLNTVCPTRYRTRHFFNNSNTNEDIATKFE